MASPIPLPAARIGRGNVARAALLLAPLLVAALAVAQLWLAGRRHETVVASSVETPRLSSGHRLIDLVTIPEQRARVFNVTIASAAGALAPSGRVRLQLAAGGFRVAPARSETALRIVAPAKSYLRLLRGEDDADRLFFERALVMEGDTEMGLVLKNTLDAIGPLWR
jgi:hypothetical protein